MKTEIQIPGPSQMKKAGRNKGYGIIEVVVVTAIVALLSVTILPSVISNIGTVKGQTMAREEYLLNSALGQAASLGADSPANKAEAVLLITSENIEVGGMTFGPLISGQPTEVYEIGNDSYVLSFVDGEFRYIANAGEPGDEEAVIDPEEPVEDPAQEEAVEEEEVGDFSELNGIILAGGSFGNNSALNGSAVILRANGAQPSITIANNAVISGDLFCPGTPTVNGRVAGIVDLEGDPDPSGYSITVGNNATVGTVYRRIESVSIPEVVLPIGLSQYSNPTLTQIAQGPLAPGKYTKLTTETGSIKPRPNHGWSENMKA